MNMVFCLLPLVTSTPFFSLILYIISTQPEATLSIVSKLPHDLFDIMHILPFWYTYLYWFLWVAGVALVLCLIVYLFARLVRYIQSLPSKEFRSETARERHFTRGELRRHLKIIMDNTIKNNEYRLGLHRMSAVLKTYFEILLKLDIEEMTAKEIKAHVKEKKGLGDFFTELTVAQYRINAPNKDEFVKYYNKALKLVM